MSEIVTLDTTFMMSLSVVSGLAFLTIHCAATSPSKQFKPYSSVSTAAIVKPWGIIGSMVSAGISFSKNF